MPHARTNKTLAALALACMLMQPALAFDDASGAVRAAAVGRGLVGQAAPATVLRTIDGGRIDLGALRGKKPVYLKFWATWCAPCMEQMPAFERLHRQYGERVEVVAVNAGFSETEAAVRATRERHGLSMPVVIDDGSLGRQLDLRVTPQHVVIGADGRIKHIGHLHDARLEQALEQAVAEAFTVAATQGTGLAAPAIAARKVFTPGDRVEGLSLKTIAGRRAQIGTAGKPQALVFFSPWCESYLRETRPATAAACRRVREQATRLARSQNVSWLGIAAPLWANADELAAYQKEHGGAMPLALDTRSDVFAAFGIRQIPAIVLLDAQGRVARVLGSNENDLAQLPQALKALGAGQAIGR